MKKLIIILAIVCVSFVALLVYGVSRSEPATGPTEKNCSTPPQGDDIDEDDFEDWCPPSLAEATRPLQARFARGLGLGKREVEISQLGAALSIPPDPDTRMRAAKLSLVKGNAAIATGQDSKQCLCRPGATIPAELRDEDNCGQRWTEVRQKEGWLCKKGDERGIIPFDARGGTLRFRPGPPARVLVE